MNNDLCDEPLDLDAIRARADAATPGPWTAAMAPAEGSSETPAEYLMRTVYDHGLPLWVTWAENDTDDEFAYVVPAVTGDGPTSEANAEFIAHAREDVPALLAEVTALRAELDAARRAHRINEAGWQATVTSALEQAKHAEDAARAGVDELQKQWGDACEEIKRLQRQVDLLTAYDKAYWATQTELDRLLGTEEDDGSGAGLAAEVRLLGEQRDAARAHVALHLSPECQHTNAHGGCDGTVVCKGRCWCACHEECDGLCVTAADVGVPGYGEAVAYAHPGCPKHGGGVACHCGSPDRCNSYTHDPAWTAAHPEEPPW